MPLEYSKTVTPVRLFFSYSTKDRNFAQELKNQVEAFGFKVFLAHQDIRPSVQWEQKILSELTITDALVPILTGNYKISAWTDQEFGFAFALHKHILPIALPRMPHGFISRFQAIKTHARSPKMIAVEILRSIAAVPKFNHRLKPGVLPVWVRAKDTKDSATYTEILALLAPISRREMNYLLQFICLEAHSQSPSTVKWFSHAVNQKTQKVDPFYLSVAADYLHLSSPLRRRVKAFNDHL